MSKAITGDTAIHVAQFLQEPVGATRQRSLAADALPLDGDTVARGLQAEVRLTRIPAGILAEGRATATVTLECMRCLEEFAQPVEAQFADEYRPTVDIMSGVELPPSADDEGETFPITAEHVLDLGESLRQATLLALPMAPHCREDCPGLVNEAEQADEVGDDRLAILGQLLPSEPDREEAETRGAGWRAAGT
jgi:uncharacterized protein